MKRRLDTFALAILILVTLCSSTFMVSMKSNEDEKDQSVCQKTSLNNEEIKLELLLDEGIFHFVHGHWPKANSSFFKYILNEPKTTEDKIEALYFYAKSLFSSENYLMASEVQRNLLTFLDDEDERFEEILWDTALVSLAINEEDAIRILHSISMDNESQNRAAAQQLLKLLQA